MKIQGKEIKPGDILFGTRTNGCDSPELHAVNCVHGDCLFLGKDADGVLCAEHGGSYVILDDDNPDDKIFNPEDGANIGEEGTWLLLKREDVEKVLIKERAFEYGLGEAIGRGEVEVGDVVRIPNSSGCWKRGNEDMEIEDIKRDDDKDAEKVTGVKNPATNCYCNDLNKPFILVSGSGQVQQGGSSKDSKMQVFGEMRKLVDEGYIKKNKEKYQLTREGIKHVKGLPIETLAKLLAHK